MTYRRVLRGSPTFSSPEPFPVAISHFSGSVAQSGSDHSFTNAPPEHDLGSPGEGVGLETAVEEAELPEVALDRNRHIIPKWLLHRHPHDMYSPTEPLRPGPGSVQHPTQLSSATASSPALIQNQDTIMSSRSTSKRLPLARQPTVPLDESDPCCAGHAARAASSFADARSAWRITTSEDPQSTRPDLRPFRSELAIGSQQSSSWFGGTGSTTVNTKLKDHIFSTILRRFHRRYKPRWLNDSHTEDEREVSTRRGYTLPTSPQRRSTSRSQLASPIERPKKQESNRCITTLRKVRSDSEMGHDGQNGSFDIDYDKLDNFIGRERDLALDNKDGIRPRFTGKRSCSRSVDPPRACQPSAPPPNQPVPSSKSSNSVPRQHHFILMEDLTGCLKHSCVLDLKMGTRQYGMDAIPSKKKSQRKKCDRTTSRPLGIRVCGMQVRFCLATAAKR